MSAWPKRHRFTRTEATLIAFAGVAVLMGFECMAAYHFYVEQRDIMSAVVIVTAWCKEGIKSVVEHFV